MMASGLPEVAIKYGITDPTVIALTLSIFLVSFGIGVRVIPITFIPNSTDPFDNSRLFVHLSRKCMVGLG